MVVAKFAQSVQTWQPTTYAMGANLGKVDICNRFAQGKLCANSIFHVPHKFIIAELSICKLGSSSVLIESSAIINLCGVSTKLNKNYCFFLLNYH